MITAAKQQVKVADEVWIVTALLHREQPSHSDFSIEEIVERARQESVSESHRKGVYVHVVQHCVANRAPNTGRYRMLFETAPGRRRLFRLGDTYNPAREGSKTQPKAEDLPPEYADLLPWYRNWSGKTSGSNATSDPLRVMREISKGLWADENPDEYVRRLREGWE